MLTLLTEKLTRPEPGSGQHTRFPRSQDMDGCAARDLNPEPAVKSPLLCYRISALNASVCRSVRTSTRIAAASCRVLTGGIGADEQTTSKHASGRSSCGCVPQVRIGVALCVVRQPPMRRASLAWPSPDSSCTTPRRPAMVISSASAGPRTCGPAPAAKGRSVATSRMPRRGQSLPMSGAIRAVRSAGRSRSGGMARGRPSARLMS